jgi:hypothetical protein
MGIVLLYWIVLAIINSSISGIFNAALYYYANTKRIPLYYKAEVIESVFKKK